MVLRQRVVGTLAAFGLAAATHQAHANLVDRRQAFPPDEDVLYLPPPGQMRVMSLGYREALADLVWIRAVIFAGDRMGSSNFAWIQRYVDTIVHLVPTFRRPYQWAGVTAIYGGQAVTRESLDAAIDMYRRGLEHFPEDHEMLFALGMILFSEVRGLPEAYTEEERDAAREEGAAMIRKAAAFGAPPLVRQLAATLISEGGTDALTIQFLESQLLHAEDENYRAVLREKLGALVGRAKLRQVGDLRARMNEERVNAFPYLREDFYVVVRSEAAP